jgi:hypothetical protein
MSDRLIGTILVQRGVLRQEQASAILRRQEELHQPFGKLAYQMYNVDERDVWSAWAEQVGHFCQHVDLACEQNDPQVIDLISAQQAWSTHMLPLRQEMGELVVATTITDLPEAMTILQKQVEQPIRFVIPDRRQLEQYIIERYGIVAVESLSA